MGRMRYKGNPAQGAIRFGSNTIVDEEYVSIGGKIYEFDDDAAVTSPHVLVTIGGSAAATAANLIAAINANKPSPGVTASADPVEAETVRLVADKVGTAGNLALVEAVSDAGITVSGANMTGGENGGSQKVARGEYVVTALDVLAANVVIETGLASPRFIKLYTRKADGTFFETSTGVVTISGSQIRHDFAGGTDLEAGDTLSWEAYE
jgi:hypothetical protein